MKTLKIDIHTHIMPEHLPNYAQKFGYGGFVSLDHHKPCCARMMIDNKFFREVEDNCWSPESRMRECVATEVDVQVLSTIPVLFNYWAKPQDCLDTAMFLNDHIASIVEKYPKKFIGLGTVPMQDTELAIKELRRCMLDLKFNLSKLEKLMDGGDKVSLLKDIKSNNLSGIEIKENLMKISPYCSMEVLLEFVKNSKLDKTELLEVLIANSNSSTNGTFVRMMQEAKPDLMDESDIQEIRNNPLSKSLRTDLEDIINGTSQNRSYLANELVKTYLSDSISRIEELRKVWLTLGDQQSLYSWANTYLAKNADKMVVEKLLTLNNTLSYSDMYVQENNDFIELFLLKSKIISERKSLKKLNNDEITVLRRIRDNTKGDASVNAGNILCYAIQECKEFDMPPLPDHNEKIRFSTKDKLKVKNTISEFSIYPNPTANNLFLNIPNIIASNEFKVSIKDVLGKEVYINQEIVQSKTQLTINTSNITNGIYFISVFNDGKISWSSKFTIAK